MRTALLLLFTVGVVGSAGGCTGERTPRHSYALNVGDPDQGKQLIRDTGCGSCHTIPGVRGANGLVGPPLISWSRRTYIAGELPNTPENLVRWLRNPQSIEPRTAMPVLGLNDPQARAIAAYLYTLR
jgi:cytochrome c2